MNKRLKIMLLSTLVGASTLLLSACALGTTAPMAVQQSQNTIQAESTSDPAAMNALLIEFYNAQSEKESYKLDKEMLKQQKDQGRIGRDEYKQKRLGVDASINQSEVKVERIRAELMRAGWDVTADAHQGNYADMDDASLRSSLYALRDKRDSLDKQKHALASEYCGERMDRAAFIHSHAEFERQDDKIYADMRPVVQELERRGRGAWTNWYHADIRSTKYFR